MSARRVRILAIIALLVGLLAASGCRAAGTPERSPNAISSTSLVESPKKFDGQRVTFTGEVIGEAMRRGDYAWLHLNDDSYYKKNVEEGAQLGGYNTGMPVWIPTIETDGITYYGDYKHEGDIVEVTGIFNAACSEHGGDMDIHGSSIAMVAEGHEVVDPIHPAKVYWAIGLTLLAAGMYLLNRLMPQTLWTRTR